MAERQSAEAMYHESGRAKRRACYRAAVRPVIPSPAGCGMEVSSEVTFKLTAYAVSSSRSRVVILNRADGEGSLFDRECNHPLERSLIVCAIRDDAAALGMSSIGV